MGTKAHLEARRVFFCLLLGETCEAKVYLLCCWWQKGMASSSRGSLSPVVACSFRAPACGA